MMNKLVRFGLLTATVLVMNLWAFALPPRDGGYCGTYIASRMECWNVGCTSCTEINVYP